MNGFDLISNFFIIQYENHVNRIGQCRHEIMGIVTEVGSKGQKFKVGDKVGVGCMVGACHSCDSCANKLENYCPDMILTYGAKYFDGTITQGLLWTS